MAGFSLTPQLVEVAESFADQPAEVDASDRGQRLDAVISHRGVDRIGTAAADADGADAVFIDIGQRDQIVDRKSDVGLADGLSSAIHLPGTRHDRPSAHTNLKTTAQRSVHPGTNEARRLHERPGQSAKLDDCPPDIDSVHSPVP